VEAQQVELAQYQDSDPETVERMKEATEACKQVRRLAGKLQGRG